MSVCLRRPLHSTLLFSSSSSSSSYTTATGTSTISPKRLGRVWSRRFLSHVSATATASTTTLRLFKLPTPPGTFFFLFLFNLQTLFHQPLLIFLYVMLLFICLELYVYIVVYSSKSGENSGSNYLCLNSKLFIQLSLIF